MQTWPEPLDWELFLFKGDPSELKNACLLVLSLICYIIGSVTSKLLCYSFIVNKVHCLCLSYVSMTAFCIAYRMLALLLLNNLVMFVYF